MVSVCISIRRFILKHKLFIEYAPASRGYRGRVIVAAYSAFRLIFPAAVNSKNTSRFTATTLAPAGVENSNDIKSPIKKQTAETIAEVMTTLRKLRQTRMEVRAGKMIKLEISMAPIIRMPTTMVTAVSNASSVL